MDVSCQLHRAAKAHYNGRDRLLSSGAIGGFCIDTKERLHTMGISGVMGFDGEEMVGPTRFELVTFCTPSKRATRLRYGPPYDAR